MKILFLAFLLSVSLGFSVASSASILCHTPRLNKVIEIKDDQITFFKEGEISASRKLASLASRTKKSMTGFSKTVNFENQKHTIHINDVNQFSEVEDYIIIRSQKGHEITFPLTCEMK